jgi:RNA-directed DNA polymerase
MERALWRVKANEGAPGIDGMTVGQLVGYVGRHGRKLQRSLLSGHYRPLPVRRKEISKPNGGVRLLGIPTVLDRLVQQMVLNVLEPFGEAEFSEYSFGFRLGRGAHDAIRHAKFQIEQGCRYWVALDLEKFFDRVHQDRLMSRLAQRIQDKRVLKLIRRFLSAGVLLGGLVSRPQAGVPQGGPLSPWLSNVVLDELDKELERRGLAFARYADDFVIFVRSKAAGNRVMRTVTQYVERKLRLRVNVEKSKVTHPWWDVFLGYSFTIRRGAARIRLPSKTIKRFKDKVRKITARRKGRSLLQVIAELNQFTRGWLWYFHLAETTSFKSTLNGWIRRRLRALIWWHWKTRRKRVSELKKRGISYYWALRVGCSRKGPWRLSKNKYVSIALPDRLFQRFGVFQLI